MFTPGLTVTSNSLRFLSVPWPLTYNSSGIISGRVLKNLGIIWGRGSFRVACTAFLFTRPREMNNAISKALRTSRPIKLHEALREEISHWLFLRTWDDPLPWRDDNRIRISLATDASASGWGGSVTLSDRTVEASDYWTKEEQELDISTKEAPALDKVLLSFSDSLRNAWVDGLVDN